MKKLFSLILAGLMTLSLAACGGSGGGKPDSAMAGAKDASKADEALAAVDSIVSAMLK